MATITLEYNSRNNVASRIIDIITPMYNDLKIKTHASTSNSSLTRKAIQEVEKGNVITCGSYEDYLKLTSQYA
jgi:uncharacterized membrane-anchored protein YitT (DUF2179 family)